MRAAASSIASGTPSSARQMRATSVGVLGGHVEPRDRRPARGRGTAARPARRDLGRRSPASRVGRQGERLDVEDLLAAHAGAGRDSSRGTSRRAASVSSVATSGAASTTCSKLSSTMRSRRPARATPSCSISGRSPVSRTPSSRAIAGSTSRGLAHVLERHERHPVEPVAARACATSIARRLLPIPPGPTSVTSRVRRRRRATRAASRPRARGRPPSVYGSGDAPGRRRRRRCADPRRRRSARRARDASNRSASRVARSASMSSASSSAVENGVYDAVSSSRIRLEELGEPLLALGGLLHVDELRHLARGEAVLVLEAGDLLAGGDPAVLLPVDADEHVALRRGRRGRARAAGAAARRARTSPARGAAARSRRARRARSGSSSFEGRADEDPQPLVGRADHRRIRRAVHDASADHARTPGPVPHAAILGRRAPVRPVHDALRA